MFDRYFCPRVAARLRASRDAEWLGSFLGALVARGYARLTIQVYLREAELFGRWLRRRRRALTEITNDDVRAFATRLVGTTRRSNAFAAGNAILHHLRERGLIPPCPSPASTPVGQAVADYDAHLRDVAGLAEAGRLATVNGNRPNIRSPNLPFIRRHAPMFSGSSCTHNTGVSVSYFSSTAFRSPGCSG